ncbi:hypothetical protein I6E68_09040 [Salinibacterium sp. NSLL150]|nr:MULTISPECIES: hypothetical protein [unclassified Salinibacterium]MBH0099282.1 hypothetical protein [Salinibacterium sp. NSLL35]MBH0102036.1 hypothetical protein [Salinibacterium sp. NSLL150]MBH0104796.1 hypothetical protein [Salinibacterium sp. NSLL16]MBH0107556.1 hypothetical protein [Salinibacterium sp. NSLL17]
MKNSGQPQSNRAPRGRRKYSRKQLGMLLGGLGALALLTVAFVAGA